jgi:single-strand DNA-binding protein
MSGTNLAIIVGRLGQDPEIRYTQAGDPVANMSIATSKKYKGVEETEWHRVVGFGKLAGVIQEWVHKGDLIGIQGEIRTRKWQDQSGHDRYSTEIIAHRMDMLGSANRNQGAHHQGEHRDKPAQQEAPMDRDGVSSQADPLEDGFDDIPF